MSEATTQEFGKWRSRLWPVHGWELKKLIPMVVMFFLILFNYTVLRDVKDAMVVNTCGAKAIPYIKIFGTTVGAILFMLIYSKLSNILSKPKLFYTSVLPFLVFFLAFSWIIYPNFSVPPDIKTSGDSFFSIMRAIILGWPMPVFYVMSELWGTVAVSLLFWGFANDVTRVGDAKRLYPLFGLFGNLALTVSGKMVALCTAAGNGQPTDQLAFGVTLHYLTGIVAAGALIIVGLYWWLNKYVLTDTRFQVPNDQLKGKKSKPKMKLLDSYKYILSSKYMLCLAIMVIGYGMAINLVEVTWKGQLEQQYTTKVEYAKFMGNFSFATGLASMFMMLFIGGNFIRRRGWKSTALFTPIALLITGMGFFAFILFKGSLGGAMALLGTTPLFCAVIVGAVQNIFSKASKYSLFDPTKEMAYIPLDQEQKVKGKAAVDVVGARLGKSGGAFIQAMLIPILGFTAMVPYIAIIVGFVIVGWIMAASSLARQFNTLQAKRKEEALEAEKEAIAVEGEASPAAG